MAQVGLDTMAGLTQGLQQGGPQSVATLRQMKTAATAQLRQVKTAAHEQAMQLRTQATVQIKELELQMRQRVTAIRQNTDAQIKQLRLNMQTELQTMSVQDIQHVKNLQVASQQTLTALHVGGTQQTALLTSGTLAQLDTLRGKAEGIMILLRDHFLSIYGTLHEDAILAGNAIGEGLAAGITMRINQIKDAASAAAVEAINAADGVQCWSLHRHAHTGDGRILEGAMVMRGETLVDTSVGGNVRGSAAIAVSGKSAE